MMYCVQESKRGYKYCRPYYANCGGGTNCDCGHSVLQCVSGKCYCKVS